jgi:hypothetical protein
VYELKVGDTFPVTGFSFKNMEAEVFLPKGNGVINFGIGIEIELVFEEPTQSIAAQEPAPAIIPDAPNVKKFFQKEQATEKKETPEEANKRARQERLEKLLELQNNILNVSDQQVVKRPALVSKYDAKNNKLVSILTQGIMATIQGKSGTHKSRLAECFAALILSKGDGNYLGYEKDASFETAVVYADTERETEEEFPAAIQRIRRLAGYNSFQRIPDFYPMSFSEEDRSQRLESLLIYLEWVKTQTNLPLLVVVDVLTDMVENINDPKDISVFDKFRKMSNQLGLTFLFVIHENPGVESSKARGHIGTELLNKSSCVMQIAFNSDKKKDDDEVELLRVSYLKTRNSKKPQSFLVKFDEATESLILADEDEVKKTATNDKYNLPDFKNELQDFILENNPKGLKPILAHFEKVWKVSHMIVSEKFHILVDRLINEEQLFYYKSKTYILAKMKDKEDKRVQNLRFIEAQELIQLEQRNLEYSRV